MSIVCYLPHDNVGSDLTRMMSSLSTIICISLLVAVHEYSHSYIPARLQDINDQLEKPTMEGIQIGTSEMVSRLNFMETCRKQFDF